MAIIMDGKALAKKVREQVKEEVEELKEKNIFPKLAVIMVGEDPASKVYVRNKSKACNEAGIAYEEFLLNDQKEFRSLTETLLEIHLEDYERSRKKDV